MSKRYPPEFRRRALDRVEAGHTVVAVAHDLEVSPQTIYNWRRQHLIDIGQIEGVTTAQSAELSAARREIERLKAELAVTRRANELLKEVASPKGGSRRSR
jgi:transposase-like protein